MFSRAFIKLLPLLASSRPPEAFFNKKKKPDAIVETN
jgi:hypothetical protein